MADVFNSTSTSPNNVQDAYRALTVLEFTPKLAFAQFGEAEAWMANSNDPFPSDTVKRMKYDLVNPNTDTINETTDPDRKGVSNSFATIVMAEHGDTISYTKKLSKVSFTPVHANYATLIANAMVNSIDLIARAAFDAETGTRYVTYVGATSVATIEKTDVITSTIARRTRAKLTRNKVPGYNSSANGTEMLNGGIYYMAIVHPDVLTDLQSETGEASWLRPQEYANTAALYNFEEGQWNGVRYVASDLATIYHNGGTGTATAINNGTLIVGTTVITVDAGTNVNVGGTITIVDQGSGTDDYTYLVESVATNDVTIGRCIAKNNEPFNPGYDGIAILAIVDGDVVKTGNDVYTSYYFGARAVGYAAAEEPNTSITYPTGKLERITDFNWYALVGYGALEAPSLHKVFTGSSVSDNSGDAA